MSSHHEALSRLRLRTASLRAQFGSLRASIMTANTYAGKLLFDIHRVLAHMADNEQEVINKINDIENSVVGVINELDAEIDTLKAQLASDEPVEPAAAERLIARLESMRTRIQETVTAAQSTDHSAGTTTPPVPSGETEIQPNG